MTPKKLFMWWFPVKSPGSFQPTGSFLLTVSGGSQRQNMESVGFFLNPPLNGGDFAHGKLMGSLHDTPEHCKWWVPLILVEKAMFQMGKMYLLRSPTTVRPSHLGLRRPRSGSSDPAGGKGSQASASPGLLEYTSKLPGPSNVPEISAPVNRLVVGIRTSFSWLVLFFLDLERFLEACGLSGPNMTYSSRNCAQKRPQCPAKRAQEPANERKVEKCSFENIHLGHLFIARAEIEESGTNCTFEQKKSEEQKGINGRSRTWSLYDPEKRVHDPIILGNATMFEGSWRLQVYIT